LHSAGCKKLLTAKVAKKGRQGRKEKQFNRSVSPHEQKKLFFAIFAHPLRTSRLKALLCQLRDCDG